MSQGERVFKGQKYKIPKVRGRIQQVNKMLIEILFRMCCISRSIRIEFTR